jgi:hypothetical protein
MKYDVVFVDQVSAAIPFFLLLSRSKVCRLPIDMSDKAQVKQPGILEGTCTIPAMFCLPSGMCVYTARLFLTKNAALNIISSVPQSCGGFCLPISMVFFV